MCLAPAFTIDRICREAKVSRGLINHYFKSKDDLLVAAYEAMTDYLPEVLHHPHYLGRNQVGRYMLEGGREIRAIRTGVQIDGEALVVESGPPELGQDTERVLGELGYDAGAIADLREKGVI